MIRSVSVHERVVAGCGLVALGVLCTGACDKEQASPGPTAASMPAPPVAGPVARAGTLPPEVIRVVLDRSSQRFRACYTVGVAKNAKLRGQVNVRFVIDPTGIVSDARDDGSDLPDATVVRCVVRSLSGLSFPAPDGGAVTVVYPLTFEPDARLDALDP